MARRNAREKARSKARQAAMTERFRSIMAARALLAKAAVDQYTRARLRGASRASKDLYTTFDALFAKMRIVSLEDAYQKHAALHRITDPLHAQAEVDEFHLKVFAQWTKGPGRSLWHTVTAVGLTLADAAVTTDEIAACIPTYRTVAGWRLVTTKADPVWIANKNRHALWGNGHADALKKAIEDAVNAGLLDPPANPIKKLEPIT